MGIVARRQPQGLLRLNRANPLGAKVIEHIPLNGNNRAVVSGNLLTFGNGGSTQVTARGKSLRCNASAGGASIPLNLSAYAKITVTFQLYWDANANDDKFAMEFTPDSNANAGAFYIDPNAADGSWQVAIAGQSALNAGYSMARPSAGWHNFAVMLDLSTVTSRVQVSVDGSAPIILVKSAGTDSTGPGFANSTLYLFSRGNSSLFGLGNIQNLTFYKGFLSADEIRSEFLNPYQIFDDPSRSQFPTIAASTVSIILESGSATDAITCTVTRPASIAESGSAADSTSISAATTAATTDALSITDTSSTSGASSLTIIESGSATDTVSAAAARPATISETGASTDSVTVSLATSAVVSEASTISDISSTAGAITSASMAEVGSASDVLSAAGSGSITIAESGTAIESTAASYSTTAAITETLSAIDSASTSGATALTVAESGNAIDSISNTKTANAQISESLSIAEIIAVITAGGTSIGEVAMIYDTVTGSMITTASVSDSLAIADYSYSSGILLPNPKQTYYGLARTRTYAR